MSRLFTQMKMKVNNELWCRCRYDLQCSVCARARSRSSEISIFFLFLKKVKRKLVVILFSPYFVERCIIIILMKEKNRFIRVKEEASVVIHFLT